MSSVATAELSLAKKRTPKLTKKLLATESGLVSRQPSCAIEGWRVPSGQIRQF